LGWQEFLHVVEQQQFTETERRESSVVCPLSYM
jgi:hypothetical protein